LNGGGVGTGGGGAANGNNFSRFYACMPVLEDGLSSGHASDTENNNSSAINLQQQQQQQQMTTCTMNDNNHHVIEHKFLDVSNNSNSKYLVNNAPNTTTFRRPSPTIQQLPPQQQQQPQMLQQVVNKDINYGSMYAGANEMDGGSDMLADKHETDNVLTNGAQQHGTAAELSHGRDNDYEALYTRSEAQKIRILKSLS
jgi:hypothetical protein